MITIIPMIIRAATITIITITDMIAIITINRIIAIISIIAMTLPQNPKQVFHYSKLAACCVCISSIDHSAFNSQHPASSLSMVVF